MVVNDEIQQVAEELPEHQSNRGDEFRATDTEDRYEMARMLVQARSQTNASNADWSSRTYRNEMRRKKERYFYHAGDLGIDVREARLIWWSVVHDVPAPVERMEKDLI